MIRKPMELQNQVATARDQSSAKPGRTSSMTKNAEASAFRLEDQTSRFGGVKLWSLIFDLHGEKVNKLSKNVMNEFEKLLPQLESLGKEGKIDVLVLLSGKKGNFI